MDLTGAQIKTVLEQQWQPTAAPSRPFLKLGISKGFTYTFDDSKAEGRGSPGCGSTARRSTRRPSYSVTVNSFLASGGDNFLELNNGTGKQDTGKTDLQAMVDYMEAFGTRRRRGPGRLQAERGGRRLPGRRAGVVPPG